MTTDRIRLHKHYYACCLGQHTVVDALFLEEKLFDFVTYVGNDYSFQLLLVGIIIITLIIEKPQVLFNRERKIESRCQHITSSASMALFRCYFNSLFWFRFPCLYPTTKRRGTKVPIPRDHHFTYICTTYSVDCPCPPIQHSPKAGIANNWTCWLKIWDPRNCWLLIWLFVPRPIFQIQVDKFW